MFLANYLIGLREGLEAALIVGIIVAFLTKAGRRDALPTMWVGIGAVVAAAVTLGAILTFGPYGLSFQAQEIIGGTLSLLAVGLVTWMIFWMAATSRHLKSDLEQKLSATLHGGSRGVVLIAVVAVAREGLETTLFVWGTIHSTSTAATAATGAILGIVTAIVLGWLIYRGIVLINLSRFFFWTGLLLIVVAAGILGYGIGDLQEAGFLPTAVAYELGAWLPHTGVVGSLLFGMFNYIPNSSWLQVIGWWIYIAIAVPAYLYVSLRRTPGQSPTSGQDASDAAQPGTAAPTDAAVPTP